MARTYQEIVAEHLAAFGIPVLAADIPEQATVSAVHGRIVEWEKGVDALTWQIIQDADITDGLWNAGLLNDWPGLYSILKTAASGSWRHTFSNVTECLLRAQDEVANGPTDVEPDLVPDTGIDDVLRGDEEDVEPDLVPDS